MFVVIAYGGYDVPEAFGPFDTEQGAQRWARANKLGEFVVVKLTDVGGDHGAGVPRRSAHI